MAGWAAGVLIGSRRNRTHANVLVQSVILLDTRRLQDPSLLLPRLGIKA